MSAAPLMSMTMAGVTYSNASRYVGDIYSTDPFLGDVYNRAALALREAPGGSWVSHHTAATLWGLWAPTSAAVHVSMPPRGGRAPREGVKPHRGSRDAWVTRMRDLRVSTPVQVVMEMSKVLPLIDLVPLIDSVLHRRYSDLDGLATYARSRNHRVRVFWEAMSLARFGAESAMESKNRLLIRWSGFPEPSLQIPVSVPTSVLTVSEIALVRGLVPPGSGGAGSDRAIIFRVDMGYEDIMFGVEYDGEHHGSPDQRQLDDVRRDALARIGWTIEIAKSRDITSHPEEFLTRLVTSYNSVACEPVRLLPDWRAHFVDWQRPDFASGGTRQG